MAEVTEVAVPDIGDFTDVPVIEILVEAGQQVAPEDPLVVLESDKATMEVPSPAAGVVQEIKVSVGDKVSEGTTILTLSADGAAPATEAAEAGGERRAGEQPEPAAEEPVEAAAQAEADSAAEPQRKPPPPSASRAGAEAPYASPSVRRRARELGIDLSTVSGTGRKGRITLDDLERGGAAPADVAAPAAPAPPREAGAREERVPLTRIQRISGPRLQANWQTIPHVTHDDEADITDLEAFRKQVNAEQAEVKVTMVALLLKACIASLKEYPQVNASLDTEPASPAGTGGEELILKRYYDLGFAADTPQGLMVPVIRDVDQKGLLQIAAELTDLSGKARSGKIGPKEIGGATFTISSLGGIGGTSFTPIINAPEVAILGVSRSAMKPVWDGSQFVPRLMLPLSLSYDHRVIDGALAARFLAHLAKVLGDMKRVLL